MPSNPSRAQAILFITQVYEPDPAAVGQYLADTARALAARGHQVTVLTAREGYDDPSARYPARETRNGVEVRRIRFGSIGKGSIAWRLLGGVLFLSQALFLALFRARCDVVVISTSPPLAPLVGWLVAVVRGARLKFWVMDLNPDQVVALGKMAPGALPVRAFDMMNRLVLRRADTVLVLDRYMGERVRAKHDPGARLAITPLWPLREHLVPPPEGENPFRRAHGLGGRRVVMYSGNHGLTNPLTALLQASVQFRDDPRLSFVFVGGGAGKAEVERYAGPNVLSLPYQPLETLSTSLSAGDVHVVSFSDVAVGILHPCKIYGAMALGRPILLLGGPASHLADLVVRSNCGWRVDPRDVEGCVRVLQEIREATAEELATIGERGRAMVQGPFSRDVLCALACDLLAG